MSLILLFVGAKSGVGPVVVKDTHDGVWDEKSWRKLQERLRKQREALAAQDDKRKHELRKELVMLYRGLPEEQIEEAKKQIAAQPQTIETKPAKRDRIETILPVLDSMSNNLAALQSALVQEYKGILAREALRIEAEEEDEFESIITAIF